MPLANNMSSLYLHPIPLLPVAVHVIVELLQGHVGNVVSSIAPGGVDGTDHGIKGVKVLQTFARGHNDHVGLSERLGIVTGACMKRCRVGRFEIKDAYRVD